MEIERCRHCRLRVRWVRMLSGKRNPLNPDPDEERGNVLIVEDEDEEAEFGGRVGTGVWLRPGTADAVRPHRHLYLSHFETCTNRMAWKDSPQR
ncbi:MAG TPA: hypothetical protein VLE97_04315 [Gaiellaceae bacterium]|nr:hypothetical protein [Gaiellaceae bacterium]